MKTKILIILSSLFILSGCEKAFLDIKPEDRITQDNFYQSDDQLRAITATLYSYPWFDFHDKAISAIGDCAAGNLYTGDSHWLPYFKLSVEPLHVQLSLTWSSLYQVVANANMIINNAPENASDAVSESVLKDAIGEAYFMRAMAYFYLVRIFNDIPYVTNNSELITSPKIHKTVGSDILKAVVKDLEYTAENCPLTRSGGEIGRVTSGSAKALMAKIYLWLQDYPNAQKYAGEVISSGVYQLMPDYADLFKMENNNNVESVFALQWQGINSPWGRQNSLQAYFAITGSITGAGDGWGAVRPTIDLINAYSETDKRRKATIMEDGDYYPEIRAFDGGFTFTQDLAGNNHAALKKQVVGNVQDYPGQIGFMATSLNTALIRYADVLLIYAESFIGSNDTTASTSNADAISAFNEVHERAGFDPISAPLTLGQIIRERRLEFAIEFDYWYDLCRINRTQAIGIISNQERGTYGDGEEIISDKVTPDESDFIMPIPESEVTSNPLLKPSEPAVPLN